ncbi:MAG: 5-oxoprolinase subunit PxpA [Geminicoccaceae bacterium]|nr:MAG: 5-oxoprolinase subunit PxpA [Geminicoccaceae bacterium]
MTLTVDLNADLGESFGPWSMGADEALLEIVTSANIACGFHAGDPVVMDQTVERALANGVGIGAHPGFDDKQGFGRRRVLGLTAKELATMVRYQLGALQAIARAHGGFVTHVKSHGALGNMASESDELASQFVGAVRASDPDLIVVAMAATALERAAADLGQPHVREVYADRAYNDDGTLVARNLPGAVLHDPDQAADRVLRMLEEGAITSIHGQKLKVRPETICVHGDGPEALTMARTIRRRLELAGVTLAPFHLTHPKAQP